MNAYRDYKRDERDNGGVRKDETVKEEMAKPMQVEAEVNDEHLLVLLLSHIEEMYPDDMAQALRMYIFEGYTGVEVAELTGVNNSTLRTNVERYKKLMKAKYADLRW